MFIFNRHWLNKSELGVDVIVSYQRPLFHLKTSVRNVHLSRRLMFSMIWLIWSDKAIYKPVRATGLNAARALQFIKTKTFKRNKMDPSNGLMLDLWSKLASFRWLFWSVLWYFSQKLVKINQNRNMESEFCTWRGEKHVKPNLQAELYNKM